MQSNNSQIHAAAFQAQAQVQPQQQPPQQVPALIQQAALPNLPAGPARHSTLERYLFCFLWDDCQQYGSDCECWTMIIVFTLLSVGIICGFIVMPCYLAKAYDDVYQDTCIIEHCNGYAANIQATGVRRSFEFFFKDKSCRSLLNKPRPCFLKLNINSNTYQVYFTRPGLVTAIVTGAIGWSIIIGLFIWAELACIRNGVVHGCRTQFVTPKFQAIFWTIAIVLIAYAAIVCIVAWPMTMSDARDGLNKELCTVLQCHEPDYGLVYAETAQFNTTVFLKQCNDRVGETLSCYIAPSSSAVIMYKHRYATVVWLGVSGWTVLFVILATTAGICIGASRSNR